MADTQADTDGPTPLSRGRRLAFSVVLGLLAILPAECALQLHYYASTGSLLKDRTGLPMFRRDATRCYAMQPKLDLVHSTLEFEWRIFTDEHGFRSAEDRTALPYAKPSDAYRILFFGPSMTFGWGNDFEEMYSTLLARELRIPGRRVEVLNISVPRQGVDNQLCWLKEVGHRYDIDLVVTSQVGPVEPVKSRCSSPSECTVVIDDAGQIYSRRPTLALQLRASLKRIALVFYAFNFYIQHFADGESDEARDLGVEGHQTAPGDLAAATEIVETLDAHIRAVQQILSPDVPVVFLYVPQPYEVHPEDLVRWQHKGLSLDPLGSRRRARETLALMEDRGFSIVDPFGALLEGARREERMYFLLDVHLTAAGHQAIADAALPVLERVANAQEPRPE